MSTAASRRSIVTAKYLYVASLGGFAGLLNLAGGDAHARPVFAPAAGQSRARPSSSPSPPAAIPVWLWRPPAGRVRRRRDDDLRGVRAHFQGGQAMITPFYMLILMPC